MKNRPYLLKMLPHFWCSSVSSQTTVLGSWRSPKRSDETRAWNFGRSCYTQQTFQWHWPPKMSPHVSLGSTPFTHSKLFPTLHIWPVLGTISGMSALCRWIRWTNQVHPYNPLVKTACIMVNTPKGTVPSHHSTIPEHWDSGTTYETTWLHYTIQHNN